MTQPAPAHPLAPDVGDRADAGHGAAARDGRGTGGGAAFGRLAHPLARAAGRALHSAGPLLLYLALAVWILWPYRSSKFRMAGDLNVVIGGIVEARNALAEGQFPLRVAPRQHDGARYPIFQFYANVPYTAAGALTLAGLSPYAAWRLVVLGALTCGGLFVYRTGRYLTRDPLAAAVGGVAFAAAPYMFTDLHARGAYPELVAFNLLPAALYATLRCLASGRRGWRYVPLAALAWALVGLTHNITYLFGVLLVGLLVVSMLGVRGKVLAKPRAAGRALARVGRLVAAGALHAGMMLWYLVPTMRVLPHIEMNAGTGSPFSADGMTNLATLLAPRMTSAPGSTTPNLGLQVGWPVAAGVLLVVLGLPLLWRRTPARTRRLAARVLLVFAAAFFVAWSPVDFWRHLPKTFWFVQFTYRLLVFTTLFGALLLAFGLAMWTRRLDLRVRRGVALAGIALAVFAVGSYVPRGGEFDRTLVRRQLANPVAGGPFDYQLAPTALVGRDTFAHPGVNLARREFGLRLGEPWLRDGALMRMAPVDGAGGLNVRLDSLDGPARLHVQVGGRKFVVRIPHGPFEFSIPLPKCFCSDAPMLGFRPVDEHGRLMRVVLQAAHFEGAKPSDYALIPAEDVRPHTRFGRVTKVRYEADRPVLLQLPVFYYPGGLQRVTNHGEPVAYGNVGRYLAVQLPPGRHRLGVEFVGVRWANAASGLAWGGVVLVPLAAWWRRRRQTRAGGAAVNVAHVTRRPRAPGFSLAEAAAGCAAILLGGGVALGVPWLADRLGDPDAVRVTADAVAAGAQFDVARAFDGKLDTAWASPGWAPTSPRVTVTREQARALGGIEFVARETVLLETWQTVHVAAYEDGWSVLDRTFPLPNAATKRTVRLDLDLPPVDRVELTFSDPVVTFPNGAGEPVSRDITNPGYSEIRMEWK
jgi:hypothetical protein